MYGAITPREAKEPRHTLEEDEVQSRSRFSAVNISALPHFSAVKFASHLLGFYDIMFNERSSLESRFRAWRVVWQGTALMGGCIATDPAQGT